MSESKSLENLGTTTEPSKIGFQRFVPSGRTTSLFFIVSGSILILNGLGQVVFEVVKRAADQDLSVSAAFNQVMLDPSLNLLGFSMFLGSTFILGGVGYRLNILSAQRRRREFSEILLRREALRQVQSREEEIAEVSGTDFDTLWALTQKRIDTYHEIATEQSRKSFRNGQVAAYGGFVVVVIVGVFAALTNSGTGAIAASVIGVAGAAMAAFIGSTFMKTQATASEQLGAYFLQPVEFARVLAAERLLDKLDPSERAPVVDRIVRSMTPVTTDTRRATTRDPSEDNGK